MQDFFIKNRNITTDCSKNPYERNMAHYGSDSHGSMKKVKLLHQYYINTGRNYYGCNKL